MTMRYEVPLWALLSLNDVCPQKEAQVALQLTTYNVELGTKQTARLQNNLWIFVVYTLRRSSKDLSTFSILPHAQASCMALYQPKYRRSSAPASIDSGARVLVLPSNSELARMHDQFLLLAAV